MATHPINHSPCQKNLKSHSYVKFLKHITIN